jgi:hypothetical protein
MSIESVVVASRNIDAKVRSVGGVSVQDVGAGVVDQLEAMSIRGLRRMFSPTQQKFVFRVRRTSEGINQEGLSLRYTAISLLGLARRRQQAERALAGQALDLVAERTLHEACSSQNLGDVALSLWAADEVGASAAALEPVLKQLVALAPADRVHPGVELAWTLSALSDVRAISAAALRDAVAARLMAAFNPTSKLFPHVVGSAGSARSHVACFADIIYPIQALAKYSSAARNQQALDIASTCAGHLCRQQGPAGQWWWHYDFRTGDVLERYPVYAIHQDAMGPMGLRALAEAAGLDCSAAITRGMQWLLAAPELNGGTLIDRQSDLIWRKVARREPNKLVRYLQSGLARVHPSLRVPAVDALFPPGLIDYEDRPYHLGWLLYAWSTPHTVAGRQSGARA